MHDRPPQFVELNRLLRSAGIAQDCSRRLVEELQDHYQDLYTAARADGFDAQHARALARSSIGSCADIAASAAQYQQLLSVSGRWPLMTQLAHGLLSVAAIPAAPLHYCAQRREPIARWGASIGLATMMTAGLLLTLHGMLGLIGAAP